MQEEQIVVFRWGGEEYAVSVKDISGVAVNARGIRRVTEEWRGRPDALIPILPIREGYNDREDYKPVILMHAAGISIALAVDEVVKVTKREMGPSTAIPAVFRIWRIRRKRKDAAGGRNREEEE